MKDEKKQSRKSTAPSDVRLALIGAGKVGKSGKRTQFLFWYDMSKLFDMYDFYHTSKKFPQDTVNNDILKISHKTKLYRQKSIYTL